MEYASTLVKVDDFFTAAIREWLPINADETIYKTSQIYFFKVELWTLNLVGREGMSTPILSLWSHRRCDKTFLLLCEGDVTGALLLATTTINGVRGTNTKTITDVITISTFLHTWRGAQISHFANSRWFVLLTSAIRKNVKLNFI